MKSGNQILAEALKEQVGKLYGANDLQRWSKTRERQKNFCIEKFRNLLFFRKILQLLNMQDHWQSSEFKLCTMIDTHQQDIS